jgi:hypothetical protein
VDLFNHQMKRKKIEEAYCTGMAISQLLFDHAEGVRKDMKTFEFALRRRAEGTATNLKKKRGE